VGATVCATVRALVCVEKCVSNRFKEKREVIRSYFL